MSFKWDRVQVWSAEVADEPGGVAQQLHALAEAGANLEFIFTERLPDKPGRGMLYVAPVSGPVQVRAARAVGFAEADYPVVRRIEGHNEPGLAHKVTQGWGLADISLHEMTLAVLGNHFVGYVAFDAVADANKAAKILGELGSHGS